MSDADRTCRARSKMTRPGVPDSDFICTNDAGHEDEEHTACNGHGRVLARWKSESSPVEMWLGGRYTVVS